MNKLQGEYKFQTKKIHVVLDGLSDIMFDRFHDHGKDERPIEQKLYLNENNGLYMPQENIYSFLLGEDPAGCIKHFEGKASNNYLAMAASHIVIEDTRLPFLYEGKEIVFDKNSVGKKNSRFWIHEGSGRTKHGAQSIKQPPKKRPVLKQPWKLDFNIDIIEDEINTMIDSDKLHNWFIKGGLLIAIGTYRPRFGRFRVALWEPIQ